MGDIDMGRDTTTDITAERVDELPTGALCHCGNPAVHITADGIALCSNAAILIGWKPTERIITTAELAAKLGVTVQAISARVRRGTLTPHAILPNGHYLFTEPTGD